MKHLERSSDRLATNGHPADLMSTDAAARISTRPAVETTRKAVARARDALLSQQEDDGHWVFEFEADCTIPAEYVLMMHFLDEIDEKLQSKLAVYIRARQADGGWPLYLDGELDISATVKAYWALKLAGDSIDAPHMVRAREEIKARGGAASSNVFTRFAMAMFGQVPWRAVPFTPVELILLPRWSPFHYDKISYWSRAVVVPLTILYHKRAKAVNPTGIDIGELFLVPPEEERNYFPVRSKLNKAFLTLERTARRLEPLIPSFLAKRALRLAEQWVIDRMNGPHGLGGVFPSMVNAVEALATLGYDKDHELRKNAREAIQRLVIEGEQSAYCQPCVSPIWDTALVALAMDEVRTVCDGADIESSLDRAGNWLADRQQLDGPADWRKTRPGLEPGGWPFQYANDHYPDLDDTAAVIWALERIDPERYSFAIRRGTDWSRGMQSANGGFGAFDADNDSFFLLEIPLADHGALLDPPTADVSARCATIFAILGREEERDAVARCTDYLLDQQEDTGAWFGRWGTNYIYGTWCVMMAFEQLQDDERIERARARAVAWLKSVQRSDGSWGESNDTYAHPELAGGGQDGTSYQTAWALLALMAAGEADTPEVRRGVLWLEERQQESGLWDDPWFSAPGFPRVFYLRYHGYSAYFPLWALARYCRHADQRWR